MLKRTNKNVASKRNVKTLIPTNENQMIDSQMSRNFNVQSSMPFDSVSSVSASFEHDSAEFSTLRQIGEAVADLRNVKIVSSSMELNRNAVDLTNSQFECDNGIVRNQISNVTLLSQHNGQRQHNSHVGKEAVTGNWQDKINDYFCKIEEQTKASLMCVKQELIRNGSLFKFLMNPNAFEDYFLQTANTKISGVLRQFLLEERFNADFANTNTIQRDQSNRVNFVSGGEVFTSTVIKSKVKISTSHQESSIPENDRPENDRQFVTQPSQSADLQVNGDDQHQRSAAITPAKSTVDNVELVLNDIENIAGHTQPTIQRQTRKNALALATHQPKHKLTNLMDTAKPYKCGHCNFSTAHKGNLTRHIRKHSNKRPYACEICTKPFLHKGKLNSHMKTHEAKIVFQCSVCRQAFDNEKSLKMHKNCCNARTLQYNFMQCKDVVRAIRNLI